MNLLARRGARFSALTAGAALGLTIALIAPAVAASATAPSVRVAAADTAPLTNLAHLDFLLDEATPPQDVAGHTTYRLAEEPTLVAPWTYADARPGGTFERVGGGGFNTETGYWNQGAYNADDIARAAVVYLRHWQLTGSDASRQTAYELLRTITYLQTAEGPNAGNVVLWMQADGTLTPSAEAGRAARSVRLGPELLARAHDLGSRRGLCRVCGRIARFAAFLEQRLALSVEALNRQVLVHYGEWAVSDGMRVPAWLIVDGADASAEAVLGLAARSSPRPATPSRRPHSASSPKASRRCPPATSDRGRMERSCPGRSRAACGTRGARRCRRRWPRHPSPLTTARSLRPPSATRLVFTPTLMTAGGPDNGWFPSPTDRVQIAYGADSRVQSLLAVADATGSEGFTDLAAMQAAWFFGANPLGAVMYDPATGVTYDGLNPRRARSTTTAVPRARSTDC